MKIMSLNVNRFSGMEERDYTESITSLGKCPKANEIIAFVKGFLCGDPDGVVFLQEVPHWKGEGKGRDFKWVEERQLYQNFCGQFSAEQYGTSLPGRGYSCTLAIWNKKGRWIPQNNIFGEAIGRNNKYVELINEDSEMRLLGIHAPNSFDFLEALKEYAENHKDKNVIILGDFNIATNEWRARQVKDSSFHERRKWLLETMLKLNYSDAIKGEPPTYFPVGTTVDHVLVSPSLKDKVTAEVKSQSELELSDHAVIIVNIEE